MARRKVTSKIALMLVALLSSGCTKSGASAAEQQRAALAVLDQSETVFYVKDDLLSASGGYKQLSQQDANTLRAPFVHLLQWLDLLGKPTSTEILGPTAPP